VSSVAKRSVFLVKIYDIYFVLFCGKNKNFNPFCGLYLLKREENEKVKHRQGKTIDTNGD
jgi:hypothetical protein